MKRIGLLLLILFSFVNANASSVPTNCVYTEEYLEWLSLDKEEKSLTLMPKICKDELVKNKSVITFFKKPLLKVNPNPLTYDLRDVDGNIYVTDVLDQESRGTCWVFSSLSSLESKALKDGLGTFNFSRNHMEYSTTNTFLNDEIYDEGYNRSLDDGGNVYLSAAYYLTDKGPIDESDMPYTSTSSLIDLDEIFGHERVLDVNSIEIISNEKGACSTDTIDRIKTNIISNGAVDAGMYMNSSYYNILTNSYYYSGNSLGNHAVNIIGWDDNYNKSNFLNSPSDNGAFIVQNSYGTSFGDGGYFYISYFDTNICTLVSSITDVDDTFSDNNYYYDYLGYNDVYGYTDSLVSYAANKYTKKNIGLEVLNEVTIATIEETNYSIYINPYDDSLLSSDLILVDSGVISNQGYTTIKLDNPVYLNGESFAVVVMYDVGHYNYQVPVQTRITSSVYEDSPILTGKSFITSNLNGTWVDLSTCPGNPIASIKVGTDNFSYTKQNISVHKGLMFTSGTVESLSLIIGNDLGNIRIYDSILSNEITEGVLKTGYNIIIDGVINDAIISIVVPGDVNGDGVVDIIDIIKIGRHIVDLEVITDRVKLTSCDFDLNDEVDILDIVKIGTLITGGAQ